MPKPLEALILKALEKDQDKRFQSAEELGQALDQVLTQLRTGVLPTVSATEDSEASSQPEEPSKTPVDVGTGEQSFSATQMGTPGPDTPTLREDEGLNGVPADPAATGGDPRFHVPSNGDLDEPIQPTLDQGAGSSTQQPTVQQRLPTSAHGTIDGADGHVTMGLSNSLMGRRRSMLYMLLALASILGGGGVGALVYAAETAGASDLPPELRDPPTDPGPDPAAANLTPVDPAQTAAPVTPDAQPAVTPPPKSNKALVRKPKKTSKRRTPRRRAKRPKTKHARIPVLGPPPTVDSHGSVPAPPSHGHTTPSKQPKPKSNDDLYDLVD